MRVTLKAREKSSLAREDYDFSAFENWPEDALRKAWAWEIERELGSGNANFILAWETHELESLNEKLEAHYDGTHPLSDEELRILEELDDQDPPKSPAQNKADLEKLRAHIRASEGKPGGKRLSDEELGKMFPRWKPPIPKEPRPMLKSYWLNELAKDMKENTGWIPSGENYFTTIQAIEVDWTKSESELVEAFRNWLRYGQHPFHTSYEHASVIKRKKGQRKTAGFLAWLRELAIYRISAAGFTRKQGLVMLGGDQISPANWEHAQARTGERIRKHLQKLESHAFNCSRLDPAHSSPHWQDYFTRL